MSSPIDTANKMLAKYRQSLPKKTGEFGRPSWVDLDFTPVSSWAHGQHAFFLFNCRPVDLGSKVLNGILLTVSEDMIGPADLVFSGDSTSVLLSRAQTRGRATLTNIVLSNPRVQ